MRRTDIVICRAKESAKHISSRRKKTTRMIAADALPKPAQESSQLNNGATV